jgi:hypothetical protein
VIVNAFHDQSVPHPARDAANQEACDRTRRFFTGYEAAGGQAAQIVIQTWQPYPDRTGPEDEPYTVLHLARDLLQDPAFPARSRRK